MKKLCLLIIYIFALTLLFGCTPQRSAEHSFFALDTVVSLKCSPTSAKEIENLVRKYEKLLSPTDKESELYRLNNNLQKTTSPEFTEVFSAAKNISEKTNGAYNFAVYPLTLEWGFTTKNYKIPKNEKVAEILHTINFTNICIYDNILSAKDGTMMDFGGVAKGFICDKVVEILKNNGEKNALISLGGNVYALGNKGNKKWEIAIKSPFSDEFAGILEAENSAVVTSGAYERYFEENGKKYHHILNPETGYPVENDLASVTIVSENATLADGYSTALFVMGFEKAKEFYRAEKNFDAIFILQNGKIYITEGIAANFSADEFDIIN